MRKLTALFLLYLTTPVLPSEIVPFTINTKKWSHVLDDHFISITVNPTDLLQGKVYGLQMNSTMAILKGLAPAYVRVGSADTAKYTFKRNRYPSDVVKPDDEYTVTETHWMVFNEVVQQAGLDVIICLNAAHRSEGTKKWDTRNSLELISFSDSQGYNLTWQLGYEVQMGDDLSGLQFGKDLNRLRTILNAFPRYQHAKLIGPDIRVVHKKEDIDFWNDVLVEAGPTLDSVTWHPRWPQPSKMKVSDNSDLGYEFPIDYLEWDKAQLNKILQKSVFKNPVWIGETKRESTGTFAEGLIWARRLVLAAKLGIEVVMKQPNLMDVTHPKPEYWIALLHKKLLGKSVLETRSSANNTDLTVISHCTNPLFWSDKPEKLQDGPVTVYGVNMGGFEQKIQIKGTSNGKSQLLFQYVLTSGSDPDSVFSQMTYLNGEPLMMTDDGQLPDIIPKIKKLEKGVTMKLPPYSVGFWVVAEAKVKICQIQQQNIPTINIESLIPSSKSASKTLENIRDINQFIVEKLKNPESESEEVPEINIELASSESSEKDISMLPKENTLPRIARKIRQVDAMDEIHQQIKTIMQETQEFLAKPENAKNLNLKTKLPKATKTMEQRIQGLAEGISDAIKSTNQEHEFNKFLEHSGLKKDFGSLIINDRRLNAPGMKSFQPFFHTQNPDGRLDEFEIKERLKRSISESEDFSLEESLEDEEDLVTQEPLKFGKKISLVTDDEEDNTKKPDLVIAHQPDIKGLEEKYKLIFQSKIQDGKRKIDDIKRKIKENETDNTQKIKQPDTVNDIQEEIIKKEIELIEKTEETVADILKNQKKRQETFEDIIFDELHDVKGERMRELEEMQKNQKKKENSIVKRQVQPSLSNPLIKTVEYIEKNFNLEPESVRKIKRSLEERMGELLRSYDTKKSMEIKKRMAPLKEERKLIRKPIKEIDRRSDYPDYKEKDEVVERPKERNFIRKTSSQLHHKNAKKTAEELGHRSRKSEDVKKPYENDNDSFELFNEKKMPEPVKKPERRRPGEILGEKKALRKSSIKTSQKDVKPSEEIETKSSKVEEKAEEKKPKVEEEKKSEPVVEQKPLKNDKQRRENMLKQITLMVDKMNSKERDGSKRIREDDDISEEFESERKSRGIRRRPRKADVVEELMEKKHEKPSEISEPEKSVKPTAATKTSRLRRLRIRPSRKQKGSKKGATEEGEQSAQKKRHLTGFDRPLLELEKEKLIKPKLKKLNPKFYARANELLTDKKPEEAIPTPSEETTNAITVTETETTTPTVFFPNEEVKKDAEEIVEEKIFSEQESETPKDKSETSEKELLKQKKTETVSLEESPTTTEGYIIVEPTEEFDNEEMIPTEKPVEVTENYAEETEKPVEVTEIDAEETEKPVEVTEIDVEETEKPKKVPEMSEKKKNYLLLMTSDEKEEDSSSKDFFSSEEILMEKKTSTEIGGDTSLSVEDMEPTEEESFKAEVDKNQRKRRATFQPNHEDEEDYSSEERIEKFKQMIYRTSPSKKPLKNEVRSTGGMGMGADEFLKMAGSTVRVMFDDVIPEAYGQTKNKIQNMGISEYIKEFGKIVQQMKNLDQIFLNIGEAAVKGYIRGNRAEKGPYIQVISRKKRELKEGDNSMADLEAFDEYETTAGDAAMTKPPEVEQATLGSIEYATTSTGEAIAAGQFGDWQNARDVSTTGRELGKVVHENDKTGSVETTETTENPNKTKKTKTEAPPVLEEKPKSEDSVTQKKPRKKTDQTDFQTKLRENGISKKMSSYIPSDLQEKIFSPWIKTTKDFIQQALTTLKRQRELSEILANDLMKRDLTKRAIGKREVTDEEPKLPVYHMVRPGSNKKRETKPKSDESLIRHLRGLQPGVYVVPTEEMTNIRSEQITNEANKKSGMPNVVTLNIYYDKKSGEVSTKADPTAETEAKISQDAVTYYQNKAWNAATSQYLTAPDVPAPVVSSVQMNPALQTQTVFAAEPRFAELPSSRLIQYPSPAYHYPPVQKMYPAIVPNPQPVYGPVYYLPQETRYASQPPGTKRQWREFKSRSSGVPVTSGWNIQYNVPGGSPKMIIPNSYNKDYKFLIQDKKRSVGDFKIDPSWSEAALPFWKFFATSESKNKKDDPESGEKPETLSAEAESSEDVFAENRKRAKEAVEKKVKTNSIEQVAEEKVAEEEVEEVVEQEEKSRKRRSITDGNQPTEIRKLSKRSYPYNVQFKDHDILPEWFGTYQEIENSLDTFPSHLRRSHIVSTPWSDEDEELLNILEADDELSLIDLDTDDYYNNGNSIQRLRRFPRSTDQIDSNMIKSNMIYKMPMDGDHLKPKILGMTGIKKLTDEDSSLETVTKSRPVEIKTTAPEEPKKEQQQEKQEPQHSSSEFIKITTAMPSVNVTQPSKNETSILPRNPHDDALYYFFKYAYDSLVKVMKSMTQLF